MRAGSFRESQQKKRGEDKKICILLLEILQRDRDAFAILQPDMADNIRENYVLSDPAETATCQARFWLLAWQGRPLRQRAEPGARRRRLTPAVLP